MGISVEKINEMVGNRKPVVIFEVGCAETALTLRSSSVSLVLT